MSLPLIAPGLAKLVDEIPQGSQWIHEMKYDGYRVMSYIKSGKITLRTRNGLDWTSRFQRIADGFKSLRKMTAIIDGEMVVFDENGVSSFSALQKALTNKSENSFSYIVFDLLHLNGEDIRDRPLFERKKLLKDLVKEIDDPHIRLSTHLVSHGKKAFEAACERKLEGLISKVADSAYPVGRNGDWVKTKCRHEEEFVICGFTDPDGHRIGFGSLLLGYWKKKTLIYCGRVGTGFDSKGLQTLFKKLKPLEVSESPFSNSLNWKERKGAHFVRPQYVAQVKYTEWTEDGHLRHPVFLGLREDKSSTEVNRAA